MRLSRNLWVLPAIPPLLLMSAPNGTPAAGDPSRMWSAADLLRPAAMAPAAVDRIPAWSAEGNYP